MTEIAVIEKDGNLELHRVAVGDRVYATLGFDDAPLSILDAATGPHPILTPVQIFVAMITITLFIPCVANFLVIAKEHGARIALGMAAFIFPFAFFVGGAAHWVATWLSM